MRKNRQTKTTKTFQYNVSLVLIVLFAMKKFGKKKRSCQASWFNNFSWLYYFKEKDSVFCIFCVRRKGRLVAEHHMEEAHITKGFNNWKKVPEAFFDHQQSKSCRKKVFDESNGVYLFSSTPRISFQR